MNNNTILAIVFLMAGTLLTTAVTTMVPSVYAEGDDHDDDGKDRDGDRHDDDGKDRDGDRHDDWNGDGVKQKAKSEVDCSQENENEGDGVSQANDKSGGPDTCLAISANVNDVVIIP